MDPQQLYAVGVRWVLEDHWPVSQPETENPKFSERLPQIMRWEWGSDMNI